jgi:hypothetical protein
MKWGRGRHGLTPPQQQTRNRCGLPPLSSPHTLSSPLRPMLAASEALQLLELTLDEVGARAPRVDAAAAADPEQERCYA